MDKARVELIPRVRGKVGKSENGEFGFYIEVVNLGDPEPIWSGEFKATYKTEEEALKALKEQGNEILKKVVQTLKERGAGEHISDGVFIDLKTNKKFEV